MGSLFKRHWQFILFCIFAIALRYVNYEKALYFIYDVGRDSLALKSIISGNLKLVGPTTGLPGFFLGPLWYYIGLPGYLLSGGSPYGIQLWYIALSAIFVPLSWILSHKLFGNTIWAKLSALLLVLSSGSISGTNFVWNPMLSLPLMAGAFICLLNARKSTLSVYIGFFLLALTLQSEFAYAIFFIVTLWPLIPWLRGKFELKTMVISAAVILLTLIPQLGFELRHNFVMTKSLLASMNDASMKVSQAELWQNRPKDLWNVTIQFVSRDKSQYPLLSIGFIVAVLFAIIKIIKTRQYEIMLLTLLTILPYGYYLFWRGNYGYFFDYYVTPHFILVIPFIIYGLKSMYESFGIKIWKLGVFIFIFAFLSIAAYGSYQHLDALILRPNNQAGLLIMQKAVNTLYKWSSEDGASPVVFRIYTPNVYTDHYDFIISWMSRKYGYSHPLTVQSDTDENRYLLYEPTESDFKKNFFLPWYQETTTGMTLLRQEKMGVLTVESWGK